MTSPPPPDAGPGPTAHGSPPHDRASFDPAAHGQAWHGAEQRDAPAGEQWSQEWPRQWPDQPWPQARRAPAFPSSDVAGALGVAALVAPLGLVVAWLWSVIAPPQLSVAQADGTLVALPTESQHRFDGLALFLMLGVAAGVLAGIGVWLRRQRRGPLALIGLALGALAGAWLASRLGVSLAEARHGVAGAAAGALVAVPPRLESWWVIVAQPLAAVFTYGLAAALNGADDLGRRLS